MRARVARALAAAEPEGKRAHWEARFLEAQERGFIPAGRINSAAGTSLTATLINCFVQPVGDSITEVVDGKPGIYTALAEAAETMRRGGGVGYDFSSIRPEGALGARAPTRARAGRCRTCASSTSRARRWNRPARGAARRWACCAATIRTSRRFIHAKDEGELTNFNISVGVTDAFMQAVEADGEFELVHKAEPARGREGARARTMRGDGLVGVSQGARARALGPGHALDLRPCGAGRSCSSIA